LPQQGRVRPRSHHQRAGRGTVRSAAPAEREGRALRRYAAHRRGPAPRPLFLRARLLLRRHGSPGSIRLVPALADAEEAARRALHGRRAGKAGRSEEHTSELQSRENLVCRLLLEKKKKKKKKKHNKK